MLWQVINGTSNNAEQNDADAAAEETPIVQPARQEQKSGGNTQTDVSVDERSEIKPAPIEGSGTNAENGRRDDEDQVGRTEQTQAGEQTLIEGIAPITTKDRLEEKQAKPISGGARGDDTQIGGLFDPNPKTRILGIAGFIATKVLNPRQSVLFYR